MVHILEPDEAVPTEVKRAFLGLAADLETGQEAYGMEPELFKFAVARALRNYDAHMAVDGYRQVGTRIEKMADSAETLTKAVNAQIAEVLERLEKVEHMAVPGGPALRRPSAPKPPETTEGDVFRAMAAGATDPQLKAAYLQMAHEAEAKQ